MPFLAQPPESFSAFLEMSVESLNSELANYFSPTSMIALVILIYWFIKGIQCLESRITGAGGVLMFIKITFFRVLKKVPCVKSKIRKDMAIFREKLNKEFTKDMHKPTLKLPKEPSSSKSILKKLKDWGAVDDKLPLQGKLSAAAFEAGEQWRDLVSQSIKAFLTANPLHFDCFPKVRQLEAEIVSMTAHLYHGDENVCGTTTGGGTESLLSAVLAYREWGRQRGISQSNILVPTSIHAGIEKAAYYFGVELRKISLRPYSFGVNLEEMEAQIDQNTVALLVSAPDYPFGIIDNVEAVSFLALRYNINCHVDACMGSYLLPFVEEAMLAIPYCCDFRNEGVTSISCDTHKYGCGPKGLSVLLYRNEYLRSLQFYVSVNWQGGIYLTPGMPGSRSGAIIAATWAVMNWMGRKGYIENCRNIVGTCQQLTKRLRKEFNKEVELLGYTGMLCIVAFKCKVASNFGVQQEMGKRGWHLGLTQHPVALQFCITGLNWKTTRAHFIEDLRQSIANAPRDVENTTKAVYGLMTQIPDSQSVKEILGELMGELFKLPSA